MHSADSSQKGLIPADGRWLWRFDTRSPLQDLQRAINPPQIRGDLKAQAGYGIDWHAAQPDNKPAPSSRTTWVEDTTGLGPPLSIRYSWTMDQNRSTD